MGRLNRHLISYTTNSEYPAISIIGDQNDNRIQSNYNKKLFIIKNRVKIISIFCDSLHSAIDDIIDELVSDQENKEVKQMQNKEAKQIEDNMEKERNFGRRKRKFIMRTEMPISSNTCKYCFNGIDHPHEE